MSKDNLPIIAIVGPPNSGKSTLFNKIAGKDTAVTSEVAGTTRDRQYAKTFWGEKEFLLVDTAGLEEKTKTDLEKNVAAQVDMALQQADVVVFLLNGLESPGQIGQNLLKKFRNQKKPVILAVNKLDSPKTREEKLLAFKKLGIKTIFAVSAISGIGIGDLLDGIVSSLPKKRKIKPQTPETTREEICICIAGKPNVGKSSIFNRILNDERTVVSDLPGTTRTAIDSQLEINGQLYRFIDTAGLKKKEHRQEKPDIYSGFQTFKSIRRSDVCFLVLDISQEITKQDQKVAQEIFDMDKGCVVLANKSDLLLNAPDSEKISRKGQRDDRYRSLQDNISHHFPFLWMCPVFFVSAKSGENLQKALQAAEDIYATRKKTIGENILREFLAKKIKSNPPKLLRDQKKPKVFSLIQTSVRPPAFELLVNHPAAISVQFRKYLENSIIKELGFWGTPVKLRLTGQDKK